MRQIVQAVKKRNTVTRTGPVRNCDIAIVTAGVVHRTASASARIAPIWTSR